MGCASSTPMTSNGNSDYLVSPTTLSNYKEYLGEMPFDLLQLERHYPSLVRKEAPFTHSDGRTVDLIKIEGTIPIRYKRKKYNIPVIIWLPEKYPTKAPFVYLNPTQKMSIHPGWVNPSSGLVSHILLEEWSCMGPSLVFLVKRLIDDFSRCPPLFIPIRPNPNKQDVEEEEAEDAIQLIGSSREHQD